MPDRLESPPSHLPFWRDSRRLRKVLLAVALVSGLVLFPWLRAGPATGLAQRGATDTPTPAATPTELPPPPEGSVRFAVIGDFGSGDENAAAVGALVAGWYPDFVVTTGDNNYPAGEAATIDQNVGQFYSAFIGNYQGAYGPGSETNRFWPSLGNHDWESMTCTGPDDCAGPYLDYFTLPGNERFYAVDLGPVHLFALDSDELEPDGVTSTSIQGAWLQNALAASNACLNVVYFHHAPYSSGPHGSTPAMQWPFEDWGADVVLAGHDHFYERLAVGGIPYIVNGAGGGGLYGFRNLDQLPPEATSLVRYNDAHGAMLVTVGETTITYQFIDVGGVIADTLAVAADCAPAVTPTATLTATGTTTPTLTDTQMPTVTATNTLTPTLTATTMTTATATATGTATPTSTITSTPVSTSTTTPTPSNTPVPEPTATPTSPPGPTDTPAAPVNLALNRPVTVSSFSDADHAGPRAVDGDLDTSWRTANAGGRNSLPSEWIVVDLGEIATLNQVVLRWNDYHAETYTIGLSEDNVAWTTVYSTTDGDGETETIELGGVSGRYVQVESTAWSSFARRMWLNELEVYGTGAAPVSPLQSLMGWLRAWARAYLP